MKLGQRVRTLADKEEIESNSDQGDMSRRPLGRKNEEPRTEHRERTQSVGKNVIFFN